MFNFRYCWHSSPPFYSASFTTTTTTSMDHPLTISLRLRSRWALHTEKAGKWHPGQLCLHNASSGYIHACPSLRFCSSIHPIPHDTIQSTMYVMLQPSTLSRLFLPSVDAGTLPFCCFSFSSNFANSARATSSSWSRT